MFLEIFLCDIIGKMNKVLSAFNPLSSCRRYDVPLWQCPQFLFLVMGLVIIGAIGASYFIANTRTNDPTLVSLIVIGVTGMLLIISFVITNSFERIADASRMKTEFISIVSHQLRAPLTNLRFSLDLLSSEKTTQEASEYYSILKENTTRMGDLIDNLLTVSRIETGKFPLRKERVSLESITKRLIQKFKPFIKASNVEVLLKEEKDLPNTIADSLWIEQVIENLLDNAVKYTPGGGKVEIKIGKRKGKLFFSIKDSGVGIPKQEQKFIFSKFFRSKNALKKQTHGSGLGLHIVKKILELSGGKIWFKSKENKGTTFFFTLPIKNHQA